MTAIEDAYSPQVATKLLRELSECIGRYYAECQSMSTPTVPELAPERYVELASQWLNRLPSGPEKKFTDIADLALRYSHRLHDPRYMGHQVPPVVPAAAFFDSLGRAGNQGAAVFEMSPFGTAAERAVIHEMGKMIGWQVGAFAGVGTHGGTLANVTALLAARNIHYTNFWEHGHSNGLKPAIMTSADSHYCIARACGILGIGTSQLIKVPVDTKRRMDIQEARRLLDGSRAQGLDVFAIVGSACTTATGSFDDLRAIASLAKDYKIWFHVDGAHGGSFLFSETYRHLLDGIDQADSIAWDAHKMLFVPALCTYLFYKNAAHSWKAFSQEAPYLFDPSDPRGMADFDGGLRTFECTKGAISLGLWGVWSLYGKDFFARLINRTMDNTKMFYDMIAASDDFEAAHVPQCNIFCFRYVPQSGRKMPAFDLSDLQRRIRQRLLEHGEGYITATKIDGEIWLRVTMINPLTTRIHMEDLLSKIRDVGI